MGTEVLRPQDCLIQRIKVAPVIFQRRKNHYGNGSTKLNNSNRKPMARPNPPERRRRLPEPPISSRSASADDLRSKQPQNNSLVLGQVTILRRGESLDTKMKANQNNRSEEIMVCGTGRLGPDPEMVRKQIRMWLPDMYAGSAFSLSPSPSSLPLPSFFNKKGGNCGDDSATRDLRRLLGLD